MGFAKYTYNRSTSGGEIITHLINSTDGTGLHFADGGYIDLLNAAGAEFGTSDFTIEFILNQDGDNASDNWLYLTQISGNNRVYFYNDISENNIRITFVNNSGAATAYTVAYDMSADYGTPTHYAFTFDRSGNVELYKNANSVATTSISGSSAIDLGAGNTAIGRIGDVTAGYTVLGTFYRFRTWNKLLSQAEVTASYENATVPFADQYGSQTIVIPGDFTGNLDGWDAYNDWNSQTNPSNNMVLAASALGQHCRNSATLTDLKKYRCTYTASAVTGSPYFANNRGAVAAISADVGSSTITAGTGNSFEFTQAGTTGNGYAYIKAAAATDVVTLDDISIVEIGCVSDYDLAFANPTQSDQVQDRAGAADGTSSATGVVQVTPIERVNINKLAVSGVTPTVSIGLDAAVAPAHMVGIHEASSAQVYTHYTNTTTGTSATDGFVVGMNSAETASLWNFEATGMQFATNNVARLIIDSAGNVGVGASSFDGFYGNLQLGDTSTASSALNLFNSTTGTGGILFADGTSGDDRVRGRIEYKHTTNSLHFRTDAAERLTISSAGLATFSAGIAFQSATTSPGGTSNESFTLSAYERGRFTPHISGSTTNPTQSYVTQVGRYEKVGRTVFVSGLVVMAGSGVSGGVGNSRLGGLPFNVSDDTSYYSTIQIGYALSFGTVKGAPDSGYLGTDGTYASLRVFDNDAGNVTGNTPADAADVTNNSALMFSGFYYTKEL